MKHLVHLTLLAGLGLAGCDLSEAERMDLSRSAVAGISCENPDIRVAGSDSIPLTFLLHAAYPGLSQHFELVWKDMGTVPNWSGLLMAWQGGQSLFAIKFETPTSTGLFTQIPEHTSKWADAFDSVTFSLSPNLCRGTTTPLSLHIYDDRPPLSLRLLTDSIRIKTGDTIRTAVTNHSLKDSILVASDYSGMRIIGDYVTNLGPGQSATLHWLVLASAGQSIWLDLGWGIYGQSRRFEFQTH